MGDFFRKRIRKTMKLNCIIFGSVCAVNLDRKEANSFLRNKRSNAGSWIFEEFKEGDLRRECYDEVCSYSEAMEAIEHVPSMIAFWGIHKNPCDTFNLCDESECDNLGNGKFQCRCADGRKGDLCDINCNQKYSETSLTALLKNDAFNAGSSLANYGATSARWTPKLSEEDIFDVYTGGMPNVWKPDRSVLSDDHNVLTVNLGQSRTIKKIRIRGGHHMGTVCTPDRLMFSVSKRQDEPAEKVEIAIPEKELITPQDIQIQPVFGQYVKIQAFIDRDQKLPPCMAVDLIGQGGRKLGTEQC